MLESECVCVLSENESNVLILALSHSTGCSELFFFFLLIRKYYTEQNTRLLWLGAERGEKN